MSGRNGIAVLAALVLLGACSSDTEPDAGATTGVPDDDAGTATTSGATSPGGGDVAADDRDADRDTDDDGSAISASPPATLDGQPVDTVNPADRPPATTPAVTAPTATIAPPAADSIGRVISLEPTHTETLFAIGAGDLVVGVNPDTDHPEAALELRQPGLERGTADLSAIESLSPDLVIVGSDDTGLAARLADASIAVWQGAPPATVDEALAQMQELGAVVGRADAATALVDEMRAELERLRSTLPDDGTLTYFHEIDPGLTTVTPGTFVDSVYAALGLTSIAPRDTGDAFTALAPDDVVAADPNVIALADVACCGTSAGSLTGRPGWLDVAAVRDGAVAEIPGRIAERWGPRLVDWWRLIADAAARSSDA